MAEHRRATAPVLAALLLVGLAALALSPPARAQEPPAPPRPAPPRNVAAHRVRGLLAFRRAVWDARITDYGRAAREFEAARSGDGSIDTQSAFLMALSYTAAGRAGGIGALTKAVHESAPDFAGLALLDGVAAYQDEEFTASVEALGTFLERAADFEGDEVVGAELLFMGRLYRALSQRELNKHAESMEDLLEAVAISRRRNGVEATAARIFVARAHVDVNEFRPAQEILEDVLRRNPGDARSYANVGLIHYSQRRFDDARPWYEEAAARQPWMTEAHEKLAYMAMVARDTPRMRRHLETLRALLEAGWRTGAEVRSAVAAANVESGFGRYWRLVALQRQRRGEDARAEAARNLALHHFEAAVREHPGCRFALDEIIKLLFERGEPASEIKPWRDRLRRSDEAGGAVRDTFC